MTAPAQEPSAPSTADAPDPFQMGGYDPEAFRMTLGDHLEELRRRIIYAGLGFILATVGCLFFGKTVLGVFCRPLVDALISRGINPQLAIRNLTDGFMVYIEISLICAAVIASPWIIWQLWQFVAAGLYPSERETITRYVPLSVGLLILGDLFVYFLILPLTLQFFIGFTLDIPLPTASHPYAPPAASQPTLLQLPAIPYEPTKPPNLAMWFDTTDQQIKFALDGRVRVVTFGAENLVRTDFELPVYVDLVLSTLVIFGLSFQLPLAVLALVRVGVAEVATLRRVRRAVYFGLAVLACVAVGGDAVTAATGLLVPLIGLYELGIWLAARAEREDAARLA